MAASLKRYVASLAPAALAGIALGWSPIGAQADLWAYDVLLRLFPPQAGPSASVILAIDEDTLDAYGGLLRMREPLARGLEILAHDPPAAAAIDIVLSEPGGEPENQRLEAALAALGNVILATHLTPATAATSASEPRWEQPLERFLRRAAALGHVHADPDADGVNRKILLAKVAGIDRRWALSLEAFRQARGGGVIRETESSIEIGGATIPSSARDFRALYIRYAHPGSPIEKISLKQLIDDPSLARRLAGRAVFIGVDILGGVDRYLMTPYSFGEAMSGVEINANAYETLARGDFLRPVSDSVTVLLACAFAAAIGICFRLWSGAAAAFSAAGLVIAAHLAPSAAFSSGLILSAAVPAGASWLCFFTAGAFHYRRLRGRLADAETKSDRYQRAVHYVTHEMRTPLTAIQGSSELISRYPLSEEKRKEVADLIHRESQRLGRMVEMFLSVEKLAAGQLELRRRAVDPKALLESCIERARTPARRKNIGITLAAAACEPIWGDPEFLEYACYNLITNAVKYSPANTSISVRAGIQDDRVRLSVEDRGYGMDESEIQNIFKRFYRTQRAEQSGETGSGLGLALVEEIVVQHGGSIEVESRANEGSRFTMLLPRAPSQDAAGGSSGRESAGREPRSIGEFHE